MHHSTRNPQETYRRVHFDARVQGADPQTLVRLCFEEVLSALDRASFAQRSGNLPLRNEAILRALSGLSALRIGVDADHALGPALITLYTQSGDSVGRCMTSWNDQTIERVRDDLSEISKAIAPAT